MDTLRELKEWVLDDIEARASVFDVADAYLVAYDERPEYFVLPAEHRYAKPVVEAFAGDSLAFAKWLRKFNNTYVDRGSEAGKLITRRAAKAQSRGINRRKRNLESDALTLALRRDMVEDSIAAKSRFKRRLSVWIKAQYAAYLTEHRRRTAKNRLSLEERDELVAKFWDELAQRIACGDLPDL